MSIGSFRKAIAGCPKDRVGHRGNAAVARKSGQNNRKRGKDASRAACLLRAVLKVAKVRPQVGLSLFADFEKSAVFKPTAIQTKSLATMVDRVIAWSAVLRALREKRDRP